MIFALVFEGVTVSISLQTATSKSSFSRFLEFYTGAAKITCLVIHLRKMNITPLAILVIKWPFSKGRGG